MRGKMFGGWRKFFLLLVLLAAWSHTNWASQTRAVLRFGIFPNLSTRVNMETYRPVADAISKAVGMPVELQTAPDFRTFYERTQGGEYDVLLTAPHLAWLAWTEAGYKPMLAYDNQVTGIIVTRTDSGIDSLPQLKGKLIAKADPLAIVVLRMDKALEKTGLRAGRDYTETEAGSHNNAALLAYQGRVDAAILGGLPFRKLAPEVQSHLQIIAESPPMASQAFLAGPNVDSFLQQKIDAAIERFMQSPGGRAFLEQGGFGGMHRLMRNELSQVDAEAREVRRMLAERTSRARN